MEEKLPTDLARTRIYEDQAKIERSIKPPRLNFNEGSHKLQRECKFHKVHTLYIQHNRRQWIRLKQVMISPKQRTIHHPQKVHYNPSLGHLWSSQHDQNWDSYNHANLKRSRIFSGRCIKTLFDNGTKNYGRYILKKP